MEDFASGGFGGGAETNPRAYFYLVYDSAEYNISKEQKKAYFDLGVKTGDDWVFIVVDDKTDNRLRGALEIHEEGRNLYKKIRESLPCFIFADGRLKINKRIESAEVHKIDNFNEKSKLIYERMGVHPPSVRIQAIQFFRDCNKIFRLNPNIFGLGMDINAFIAKVLDSLEDKVPKMPSD